MLFASCIVAPAVLAIGALVTWNLSQVREAQEAALLALAQTTSSAVDLEMTRLATGAAALATSDSVSRRDWAATRRRLAELDLGSGVWVAVTDKSGRRLLNTAPDAQPGAAHGLPRPDSIVEALGRKAPVVTDLFRGASTNRQVVAIDIPVDDDPDELVISLIVDPVRLLPSQAERDLPRDAFATIIDRRKRVIARTRDHDRWQGVSATSGMIAAMSRAPEGVISSRSLEGEPTTVAYTQSAFTGWTTLVVLPRSRFMEPVWRNAAAFALSSALLVLLGIWLSRTFGRSLIEELHELESDAERLGAGGVIDPRPSRIENVGSVQQALSVASHELHRRESRQDLMIHELNHRVKNTLATVQGLAAQTFRGGDPEAPAKFDQRLAALASAHDLLTRTAWEAVDVSSVVARCSDVAGAALDASGPPAPLPPHAALALCMCLHELVTNSMKYGALSRSGGRVRVTWTYADGEIGFVWKEEGGPPVVPPDRTGFGSRLIVRLARTELGGDIEHDFAPSGLVVRGRFRPGGPDRFRNSFE